MALAEFITALNAGAEITRAARSLFPFPGPDGDGFFRLRLYRRGARRSGLGSGRRDGLFFVALRNPALLHGNDDERDQEQQAHQQAGKDQQQAIENFACELRGVPHVSHLEARHQCECFRPVCAGVAAYRSFVVALGSVLHIAGFGRSAAIQAGPITPLGIEFNPVRWVRNHQPRLALNEHGIAVRAVEERVWERREEFLVLNPACTTPVLVEEGHPAVPGAAIIAEYLDETRGAELGELRLLPRESGPRVEVRRLPGWFNDKFFAEVSGPLTMERLYKRQMPASDWATVRRGATTFIAGAVDTVR